MSLPEDSVATLVSPERRLPRQLSLPRNRSWTRKGALLLPLLLLSGALYTFRLGSAPLSNPDEGLYAQIPKEMAESGDFVTPRCNGARYPDKPPLLYWLTSSLYAVAGVSEFTARFWNAMAGVLGVAAVFFLARELFNPLTGILSAVIYSTTAGVLLFSRILLLDQLLTSLLALSLLGAWKMLHADTTAARRGWAVFAGGFAGAMVLTKGLLGLAFPAGVVVLACLWDPPLRRLLRKDGVLVALGTLALVAVPWHVKACLRDPELSGVLFFNEQIGRFFNRREPLDYETLPLPLFLAISFGWSFPWLFSTPMAVHAARLGWRKPRLLSPAREARRSATRFLLAWMGVVLIFFSVSSCRLPPYSLPMLPALAILLAQGWRSLQRNPDHPRVRPAQISGYFFAFLSSTLLLALIGFREDIARLLDSASIVPLGLAALAFLTISAWVSAVLLSRRPAASFVALAVGAFALCGCMTEALSIYQSGMSFKGVVQRLHLDELPRDATLVLEHPHEYESIGGLCFYSRRKIRVLERTGRPRAACRLSGTEDFYMSEAELRRLWDSQQPVYFVSEPDASGTALPPFMEQSRVLGKEGGRTVMANSAVERLLGSLKH